MSDFSRFSHMPIIFECTDLQVILCWNLLLQEHLAQHFISVGDTLHQLLPPLCSFSAKFWGNLVIADVLTA